MFTEEAIIALQEHPSIVAASVALTRSNDTKDLVALPSDYKLHDLESHLPLRRRARGVMETSALAAFGEYTLAHKEPGASVFVSPEHMTATAVLNLGTPDEPGQTDNRAKLTAKRTAAFDALLAHTSGQQLKQATVAEFLEDWQDNIFCQNAEGPVPMPKAVAAIRKLTIESIRKLESSEQNLGASRSAFESVQATSADPIPTGIAFTCNPYQDLEPRTFLLRLSILTGDAKPVITLRIIKREEHTEQMAEELAGLIESAFSGESIPVMLGGYSKGN